MLRASIVVLAALAAVPAGAVSAPEILSRIPPEIAPDTANGGSQHAALSADGRFVLLTSLAENLVNGVSDLNNSEDVFLFDRVTGERMLVSQSSGPEPVTANRYSRAFSMSSDGRFVAFLSAASDLVPGHVNPGGVENIFLWDRVSRTTELVSHESGSRAGNPDGSSSDPVVSANGRFVAYQSAATDLVDGVVDRNGSRPDVFLYDRRTGENVLVSRSVSSPAETASSRSAEPTISADGRFVAFASEASDLVAGQLDRLGSVDFFLWDRTTGRTVLISHAAASGATAGNQASFGSAFLSANGDLVAFGSHATNLVPRQRGGGQNVFLWQRTTGAITLVTHAPSSLTQGAGGFTYVAGISADGSSILYSTTSTGLVPGQRDHGHQATWDVFLWSRQSGQNRLLSGRDGSAFRTGDAGSWVSDFSADASWVLIQSEATDLVPGITDTNTYPDIFLWSRRTGRLTLVSHAAGSSSTTVRGSSGSALISADGQFFAYLSSAPNLVAGFRDANQNVDVVLESQAGDRDLVSLHAPGLASVTPRGSSVPTSASADGRWVVFMSNAADFLPRQADRNGDYDVFLRDRVFGTTTLVSHAAGNLRKTGNRWCVRSRISADGRFVAMACNSTDLTDAGAPATDVPPDQLYVWSRETGAITLVSRTAGTASRSITGSVSDLALSADGSVITFVSTSTDLVAGQVDTPDTPDVFVWERATGTVSLLSGTGGSPTVAAAGVSDRVRISADGRFVVFDSTAPDLGTGLPDTNGQPDVFLRDRAAGSTALVTRTADGAGAAGGATPRMSADGRFVAFTSWSDRIVPGQVEIDPENPGDLFLWDRQTGATRLVSHSVEGPQFATGGIIPNQVDLDAAGRFLAFTSSSTRLVSQVIDENQRTDVFLFDRESGATSLVSRAQGATNVAADDFSGDPLLSADGRLLAFESHATNLASDPEDPRAIRKDPHVYLYDRSTDATSLLSHSFLSPSRRSFWPASLYGLAASGSVALVGSQSMDLAPLDFNGAPDAFAVPLP